MAQSQNGENSQLQSNLKEENKKKALKKQQELLQAQQNQPGQFLKNPATGIKRFNEIAREISQQPNNVGHFQCQPGSAKQVRINTNSNLTIIASAQPNGCVYRFQANSSTQQGRQIEAKLPPRLTQIQLLAEVMYAQEKANSPDEDHLSLNIRIVFIPPENARMVHDYFTKFFSTVTINGKTFKKKKDVKIEYETELGLVDSIAAIDEESVASPSKFEKILEAIFPVKYKKPLSPLDDNTRDIAITYLIKQWDQLLADEKTAAQELIKQRQTIYKTKNIDPKRLNEITLWQTCFALDGATAKKACPAGLKLSHPLYFYFSDKIDGAERVNHAFKQWLDGKSKEHQELFTQQLRFGRQDRLIDKEKLNRQVYFTHEKELTCPVDDNFLQTSNAVDLVTAMENIATENNVTTKDGRYAIADEMYTHLKTNTTGQVGVGVFYGAFKSVRIAASNQLIANLEATNAVCKAIASYSPKAIIAILQPVYNKQDTVEKKVKFHEVLDEILKVGKNPHDLSEVNQEEIKKHFTFKLTAVLENILKAINTLNNAFDKKLGTIPTAEQNNFIAACKPLKMFEDLSPIKLTQNQKEKMKCIATELNKLLKKEPQTSARSFFQLTFFSKQGTDYETLKEFLTKSPNINSKLTKA